ncbi:methyltransferase family protein [Caviibacterium pharyngocola]|uniref:Isoprenylcysteine carboxyl methyltransferase n=1 Tax=Caviibacterium pharyngocola TaxID=28159 RepID=A0A2M8RZ46_9PAST|nr:isoprenylcysteine carboxylmethyltransferase family protein [Caviibacterium pharyngocola]PJG84148.1 isoprenylcysteine carboxyl methyltransferase [Caviibacterium pharyngocola]
MYESIKQPKIPPPFWFIACAALVYATPAIIPFTAPLWIIAPFILSACGIAAISLWQFHVVKTTVHPLQLEKTSVLVTNGIYRISRNPMYLSLLLLLISWCLYLGSLGGLLGVILFVFIINELHIKPEEKVLTEYFGNQYREYQRKVRRWV